MRYHLLGRTGLYVSEFCLGTMTFGGEGGLGREGVTWSQIGKLQIDDATALVKRAFDAGVNFIDTANVYSIGRSESLTGEALKRLGIPRDQIVLATKATGIMDGTPNGRGQSRYHLMNEIGEAITARLEDRFDVVERGHELSTHVSRMLGLSFGIRGRLARQVEHPLTGGDFNALRVAEALLPMPRIDRAMFHVVLQRGTVTSLRCRPEASGTAKLPPMIGEFGSSGVGRNTQTRPVARTSSR